MKCMKRVASEYDENIEEWITVKGNHIPIKKGQTKEDALNDFFKNKNLETPEGGKKGDITRKHTFDNYINELEKNINVIQKSIERIENKLDTYSAGNLKMDYIIAKGNLDLEKKNLEEKISLLNGLKEKRNFVEENNLFDTKQGKNTHEIEDKGFKNMKDVNSIKKQLKDLNFIRLKSKKERDFIYKSDKTLFSLDELNELLGGKTFIRTNVSKNAPDWAKEKYKLFQDVWNNVFTDDERSNFHFLSINYGDKEDFTDEKGEEVQLGSVVNTHLVGEKGEKPHVLRPSTLTINLIEDTDLDETLNTALHENRHAIWNNKIKNNPDNLDVFTDKILEMGKEKALTAYVKTYYNKLDKLDKQDKDYEKNKEDMELLIANETHSEYFAFVESPLKSEIKKMDKDVLKTISKLMEEYIYEN